MKDYKRLSEPLVKIPKSVQQMIPVGQHHGGRDREDRTSQPG